MRSRHCHDWSNALTNLAHWRNQMRINCLLLNCLIRPAAVSMLRLSGSMAREDSSSYSIYEMSSLPDSGPAL